MRGLLKNAAGEELEEDEEEASEKDNSTGKISMRERERQKDKSTEYQLRFTREGGGEEGKKNWGESVCVVALKG